MTPELKARLGQLARTPAESLVASGSPETVVIRFVETIRGFRSIDAIRSLSRRGVPLLKAKRAIEHLMSTGEVVVTIPMVECSETLAAEFTAAGIVARKVASSAVDIKAIRAALGLTQEQFAARFALDVDALQNWEQGRCRPDKPAEALLRAIAKAPDVVARAQETELV